MNGTPEQVHSALQPSIPEMPVPAAPLAPVAPTPPSGRTGAPPTTAGRPLGLPRKSPFLACVLSLLPGVGQIYVGYYKLGFIHNLVFGATVAFLVSSGPFNPLIPLMGIFLGFFVVYNVVDAGRRAVFHNLALDGVEGIDLPDVNISLPSFRGSIGGGLAWLVVGFILLLNTRFGVSLAWIEEWWPVVPMGLGAYLLVKSIQDRRAAAPSTAASATERAEPDSTGD